MATSLKSQRKERDLGIQTWIESTSWESQNGQEITGDQDQSREPPLKRARRTSNSTVRDGFDYASNTIPNILPRTDTSMLIRRRTFEKGATSPTTRCSLEQLEKPVNTKPLPVSPTLVHNILPADVNTLYGCLRKATEGIQIMPHEVRDDLEKQGEKPLAHFFRELDKVDGAVARAKWGFDEVCEIVQGAAECSEYQRHENAWNQHVHEPLLKLVFTSNIPDTTTILHQKEPQLGISVRYETVVSATIAGGSIPRYQRTDDTAVHLPCTVSVDGDVAGSATESVLSYSMGEVHSRSNRKKVDYVLVMDILDGAPLQQAISKHIDRVAIMQNTQPQVNQTVYRPL